MTRRLTTIVSIMASVALASCQCNSLRIEGDVSNLPDGPIVLSALDSTIQWRQLATADVKNGKFEFAGHTKLREEECLLLTSGTQSIAIFASNGHMTISGNALRPEDMEVKGSAINDKLVDFTRGIPGKERLAQITALLASTTNNVDKREELTEEARSIENAQLGYIRQAIADNASSPLGPFLLLNHIGLFSFEEADAYLKLFANEIPNHKYVRYIKCEIERHRSIHDAQKRVAIGQPAPDITLIRENGDTITLSQLRGQVVLIDFWQADSDPCRKNNQIVMSTLDKFASIGFMVVGISTDTDEVKWRTALKAENLKGIQVMDKDGSAAKQYAVQTLPASFIIDEDGIIAAKDVNSENIFADIECRMQKHANSRKK